MWLSAVTAFVLAAPPSPPAPAATPAPAGAAAAASTAPAGSTTFPPITDKTWASVILTPRSGRVVLVNFWASYCLPCLEEMPSLVKLREQFKEDVDVVFVSTDDPAMLPKADKILKRWKIGVGTSYFVDGDPDAFMAAVDPAWMGAIPHTIIYGRDGRIHRKLPGGQSAETFEESLRAAIAAPATTEAPKPTAPPQATAEAPKPTTTTP